MPVTVSWFIIKMGSGLKRKLLSPMKEIIVSDDYVGYAVNSKAKTEQITKSFKIHYSNKGVHIVPREE